MSCLDACDFQRCKSICSDTFTTQSPPVCLIRKTSLLSGDVMSNDRPSFPSRSSRVPLPHSSTIATPNYSSILRTLSPHSKDNTCLIRFTYAVNTRSLALNMSVTFLVRSFEDVKSERIKGRGRCTAGKTTISLYGLGDKTCGAVLCVEVC